MSQSGKKEYGPFYNQSEQFSEMFKKFNEFKGNVDRDNLLINHKKNMDTLGEVNKLAMEVMRSVNQLQTQYFRQAFEEMGKMATDYMNQVSKTNLMNMHTEGLKSKIDAANEMGVKITNQIAKSGKDMYEVLKQRVSEGMEDMRNIAEKNKKNMN